MHGGQYCVEKGVWHVVVVRRGNKVVTLIMLLLLFSYTDSILFCCGILMPAAFGYLVPPASLTSAPYPEWAHHHW